MKEEEQKDIVRFDAFVASRLKINCRSAIEIIESFFIHFQENYKQYTTFYWINLCFVSVIVSSFQTFLFYGLD